VETAMSISGIKRLPIRFHELVPPKQARAVFLQNICKTHKIIDSSPSSNVVHALSPMSHLVHFYFNPALNKPTDSAHFHGGYLPSFTLFSDNKATVQCVPLPHTAPCWGYVIEEAPSPAALDAVKLGNDGLPKGPLWKQLKSGKTIQILRSKLQSSNSQSVQPTQFTQPNKANNAKDQMKSIDSDTSNKDQDNDMYAIFRPEDYLIQTKRKQRKIALLFDTHAALKAGAWKACRDADIVVHEATYHEGTVTRRKAINRGHSTAIMAGEFARMCGAKNLIISHFSPRYEDIPWFANEFTEKANNCIPSTATQDADGTLQPRIAVKDLLYEAAVAAIVQAEDSKIGNERSNKFDSCVFSTQKQHLLDHNILWSSPNVIFSDNSRSTSINSKFSTVQSVLSAHDFMIVKLARYPTSKSS
jgi:ribonuclease BN (tRNA processing enzyme)